MKKSSLVILIYAAVVLSGCGELGEQLGLSEKKKSGPAPSCYGYFYDAVEDVYRDWRGPVKCQEDVESLQYRVYWNQCTGGDEIIGYNFDAQGNKQYCSNSQCSMEDRKRGIKYLANGITIECGFSTPTYIQQYYQGYNTGYQYNRPTSGAYVPFGGQAGF